MFEHMIKIVGFCWIGAMFIFVAVGCSHPIDYNLDASPNISQYDNLGDISFYSLNSKATIIIPIASPDRPTRTIPKAIEND